MLFFHNPLGSQEIVNQVSKMGDIQSDPFSTPDLKGMLPDFTSIAMLPIKLSMYSNSLRMSYYGTRSLMHMGKRYGEKNMRYSYRSQTVNGIIGDLIGGFQRGGSRLIYGEAFTFGKTKGVKSAVSALRKSYKDGGWRAARRELHGVREALATPPSIPSEMKPWKYLYSRKAEEEYVDASGTWKYGYIDQFYVSPKAVNRGLQRLMDSGKISKSVFENLTTDNKLASDITRNLVRIKQIDDKGNAPYRYARSMLQQENLIPNSTKEAGQFFVKNIKNHNKLSIFDVVRGVEPGQQISGGLFSIERARNRVRMFTGKEGISIGGFNTAGEKRLVASKATFWWNRKMKGLRYMQITEATQAAAMDNGLAQAGEYKVLTALTREVGESSISRLAIAKTLKAGAMAMYLVPQIAKVAMGIVRKGEELVTRASPALKNMFTSEFGDGMNVLSNARMATERQRAISAIQNAHMSARYLMGNEASLYH